MTALSYDDIVWACTNLCDLIEFENEALARHDSATVREISDNKHALARIYEQAIAPMAEDPAMAEDLPADQKDELVELGRRLQKLVEENERRLRAEMTATQMLMDAMMDAVKAQATQTTHYGKQGTFGMVGGSDHTSVSFNKTL